MTLYSAALGVAIAQACYSTGEKHERAALQQLLCQLDLDGVLTCSDALHTQKPFFQQLTEQGGRLDADGVAEGISEGVSEPAQLLPPDR